MKKEINQKDIDKILTLKNMTKNICKSIEEEHEYIKNLFQHFQEDKYFSTNFFIEGTTENDLYNFLDYLDREFLRSCAFVYIVVGSLRCRLNKFKIEKKNKKEQRNNENN